MTFEEWWERRGPEAVHMSWTEDVCRFAWQAATANQSERIAALEAKCALYAASLDKADREIDALKSRVAASATS